MRKVLVTGGNGQLATCIKDVSKAFGNLDFIYVDSDVLDITNAEAVASYFSQNSFDWCVNCAAYTAVDKAESEVELSAMVNREGAKNLAISCASNGVKLIQISTDFVFGGDASLAYTETDIPNPKGVYGLTKLEGETEVINHVKEHFIIRTSWLYSEHANNFMKTMLRLAETRSELGVVADQIGTPTYATDLSLLIASIIDMDSTNYGLYHYSNEGVASWYDFAHAIFELSNIKINLSPIKTTAYPTPAARPQFSVMDKSKVKDVFNFDIPHWRESLKIAIKNQK